jgi:hypothetical protein
MEATCSSETSVGFQRTTWHYILGDFVLLWVHYFWGEFLLISKHPSWDRDIVTCTYVYEYIYQVKVVISDYRTVEYVITARWTNTQNMNEVNV